ncbi:hypothetical protein RIB2604_01805470 [Aspergillus luchuensis]|uniref:Uncharacterized protein n=1 Tax=Aspergillus kawachii TaxID=1069201 RepID=A0A146FFU0_ASPKA|nr:hypothetical protein RIB2604_01805470 [Aspergillus luchuensis]
MAKGPESQRRLCNGVIHPDIAKTSSGSGPRLGDGNYETTTCSGCLLEQEVVFSSERRYETHIS